MGSGTAWIEMPAVWTVRQLSLVEGRLALIARRLALVA
jgi:hypothetical protein